MSLICDTCVYLIQNSNEYLTSKNVTYIEKEKD